MNHKKTTLINSLRLQFSKFSHTNSLQILTRTTRVLHAPLVAFHATRTALAFRASLAFRVFLAFLAFCCNRAYFNCFFYFIGFYLTSALFAFLLPRAFYFHVFYFNACLLVYCVARHVVYRRCVEPFLVKFAREFYSKPVRAENSLRVTSSHEFV